MHTATYKGNEYTFDFDHLTGGLRLWVMRWEEERRDYVTVYNLLHPLATEFDALCAFAGEYLGEAVEAEELAQLLDIPLRTNDDISCIKCDTWGDAYSEDFVHGTDALPEKAESLGLGNWDYVCMECYLNAPGGGN